MLDIFNIRKKSNTKQLQEVFQVKKAIKENKQLLLLLSAAFVVASGLSVGLLAYNPQLFFDSLTIVSPRVDLTGLYL